MIHRLRPHGRPVGGGRFDPPESEVTTTIHISPRSSKDDATIWRCHVTQVHKYRDAIKLLTGIEDVWPERVSPPVGEEACFVLRSDSMGYVRVEDD